MSVTKKLIIRGRVQGVGFRYSMCDKAESMGIVGTVSNREDGSVEAVIQGDEEQVAAMLEWAKNGPAGARVDRVEVIETTGTFSDFSIRH